MLAMSGYNASRDELYLRLSPDCSSEPITATERNALSDELSEDEHLYYKCLARFPRFDISSSILVSGAELKFQDFIHFIITVFVDCRIRGHTLLLNCTKQRDHTLNRYIY